MAHTENLFARHRFELIILILCFYFTIWLGLQMKSWSHLLQRLWWECHIPAGCCGVPVGFLSIPQRKGGVWVSVGGGSLSCTHCWTVPGRHIASNLISELLGWKRVLSISNQPWQTPAQPDALLPPASHWWSRFSGISCLPAARNRLLISSNRIWKTNQKIWFLR